MSHTLCIMIHTCKWHNEQHLVSLGSTYIYIKLKNVSTECFENGN